VLYLEPPFSGVSAVVTAVADGMATIDFNWVTNVKGGPPGGDFFGAVARSKREPPLYFPVSFRWQYSPGNLW
jgi:hypothetical protein